MPGKTKAQLKAKAARACRTANEKNKKTAAAVKAEAARADSVASDNEELQSLDVFSIFKVGQVLAEDSARRREVSPPARPLLGKNFFFRVLVPNLCSRAPGGLKCAIYNLVTLF